ncbi:MAG: S1 family peptidase, partial [Microthrixaceae bacterium]
MSTAAPALRRSVATVALSAVLLGGALTSCSSDSFVAERQSAPRPTTTAAVTTTTLKPDEILDLARDSIIRVRNTGCGELGVGSAWLAEDGSVITNRHVVESHHDIEMLTWDGFDLTPTAVEFSTDLDIARLHGDWSTAAELRALPVRSTRVEPGERISIVGFPEGEKLAVSSGVAVGYGPEPDEPTHEVLKLTTVIKPGNSGGPAIDVNGQVVGVTFAKELATDEALVIP